MQTTKLGSAAAARRQASKIGSQGFNGKAEDETIRGQAKEEVHVS